MNPAALLDLLHSLGSTTPVLRGALCRSRIELFDSELPDDITEAVAVCRRCPARQPYGEWASTVAPRKLVGVIAGQHYPFGKRACTR